MILLFKTKRKVIFVKQINDDSKDTSTTIPSEEIVIIEIIVDCIIFHIFIITTFHIDWERNILSF